MRTYMVLCAMIVWACPSIGHCQVTGRASRQDASGLQGMRSQHADVEWVRSQQRAAKIKEQEQLAVDCPKRSLESWHLPPVKQFIEPGQRVDAKPKPRQIRAKLTRVSPNYVWLESGSKKSLKTMVVDRDDLSFAEQVKVWVKADVALKDDPDKKAKWPAWALEKPTK